MQHPLPAVQQPQRAVQQPQRAVQQPQRAVQQPQRAVQQPQRAVQQPQPAARQPQPETQQPQPETQQPQPAAQQPQPAAQQPQPAAQPAGTLGRTPSRRCSARSLRRPGMPAEAHAEREALDSPSSIRISLNTPPRLSNRFSAETSRITNLPNKPGPSNTIYASYATVRIELFPLFANFLTSGSDWFPGALVQPRAQTRTPICSFWTRSTTVSAQSASVRTVVRAG